MLVSFFFVIINYFCILIEETEDNSKLLEKKQNPNRNDKENKPTRLNESEKVVSQEDKSLNKQEILSLKDNLKDTSKNMSKDENTFLNVNEYFRDLSKNSNTKASRNSSLEPTNPIEVQLEGLNLKNNKLK